MAKSFLYQRVKEYLEECIREHEDDPFYLLPSETQLMIKFNVSRVTATNAINALVREGKIVRKQGKGSFIKNVNESIATRLPRNKFITLVTPNFVHHASDIIRGANDYLKSIHYPLLIMSSFSSSKEESVAIHNAANISCSGLLIYPINSSNYNREILSLSLARFPMVLIDRKLVGLNLPYVASNHFQMSYDITELFFRHGHRQIGYADASLFDKDSTAINERRRGYRKAYEDRGMLVPKNLLIDSLGPAIPEILGRDFPNSIRTLFRLFLERNPKMTAVLCPGEAWGTQMRLALSDLCRSDIELAIFDNMEDIPFDPKVRRPLYIIEQDSYQIGYRAAQKLVDIILSGNSEEEDILIPHSIVEKD